GARTSHGNKFPYNGQPSATTVPRRRLTSRERHSKTDCRRPSTAKTSQKAYGPCRPGRRLNCAPAAPFSPTAPPSIRTDKTSLPPAGRPKASNATHDPSAGRTVANGTYPPADRSNKEVPLR